MYGLLFKETYFYALSLFLFFLDIVCFSFMEKQLLYTALCFFFIQIYKEKSISKISFLAFLISLESLLYFGKFGMPLFYLIPLGFISFHAQKNFHALSLQPYFLLACCIILQSMCFEPLMLHLALSSCYTFYKIIANIIVLWFLSLIDTSLGNLGNRFNPFTWFKEESPDS